MLRDIFHMKEFQYNNLRSDPNLVAYWRLEGNANDEVGSNNGTPTNIQYGAAYGRFGQGAGRNGTIGTNWITVPHIAGLNGNLTVVANVRFTSVREQGILSKGLTGSNIQWGFKMGSAGASNRVSFFMDTDGSWGPTIEVSDPTTPSTGVWYQYVAVYNGATLKVYRDGVEVASQAYTNGSYNGSGSIYLGNFYDTGSGYGLDGDLDDCYIFNRALSASEVKLLTKDNPFYNPIRGSIGRFFRNHPGMVWYSQFDGSSRDNSGGGNNGSDSNMSYPLSDPALSKSRFFAKRKRVAAFNGSNGSILVSDNFGIGSGPCTLMGWFSISSQIGSGQWTPIVVCDSATNVYYRIGVYAYNGGNRQMYYTRGKNGAGENNFSETLTLEVGRKYFFALTYDGTTLKGFRDGKYTGSVAASGTGPTALTNGMRIGSWISGSDELWNGEAGECAVFKGALPDSVINQYYRWAVSNTQSYKKWWITAINVISATFSETAIFTGSMLRTAQRIFSENGTFTATFTGVKVLAEVFSEMIIFTASMLKITGKILSETGTFTISLIKTPFRVFSEIGSFTGSITSLKALTTTLFEQASFTSTLIRIVKKTFSETGSFTATLISVRSKMVQLTEVVTHTDSILKSKTKIVVLIETISFVVTFAAYLNGILAGIWKKVGRETDRVWRKISKNP
jgi:hypothetical protein